MFMSTTYSAKHTFQESGDPAEQLINVAVGVPNGEKVEIDMFENSTVYQRL